MSYSVQSVANAFLRKSFVDGNLISPMKIQKLVYMAHGYCLCYYGKPAVDETFKAWKFGPVLTTLYHECKIFSIKGIDSLLTELSLTNNDWKLVKAPDPQDEEIMEVISFVWEHYKGWKAGTLSNWTHEKNSPWSEITQHSENIGIDTEIPNEKIEVYFKKLLGK